MAKVAKRPAVAAPQNKEELNEFIRELGELQRQQDELNTALARRQRAAKIGFNYSPSNRTVALEAGLPAMAFRSEG